MRYQFIWLEEAGMLVVQPVGRLAEDVIARHVIVSRPGSANTGTATGEAAAFTASDFISIAASPESEAPVALRVADGDLIKVEIVHVLADGTEVPAESALLDAGVRFRFDDKDASPTSACVFGLWRARAAGGESGGVVPLSFDRWSAAHATASELADAVKAHTARHPEAGLLGEPLFILAIPRQGELRHGPARLVHPADDRVLTVVARLRGARPDPEPRQRGALRTAIAREHLGAGGRHVAQLVLGIGPSQEGAATMPSAAAFHWRRQVARLETLEREATRLGADGADPEMLIRLRGNRALLAQRSAGALDVAFIDRATEIRGVTSQGYLDWQLGDVTPGDVVGIVLGEGDARLAVVTAEPGTQSEPALGTEALLAVLGPGLVLVPGGREGLGESADAHALGAALDGIRKQLATAGRSRPTPAAALVRLIEASGEVGAFVHSTLLRPAAEEGLHPMLILVLAELIGAGTGGGDPDAPVARWFAGEHAGTSTALRMLLSLETFRRQPALVAAAVHNGEFARLVGDNAGTWRPEPEGSFITDALALAGLDAGLIDWVRRQAPAVQARLWRILVSDRALLEQAYALRVRPDAGIWGDARRLRELIGAVLASGPEDWEQAAGVHDIQEQAQMAAELRELARLLAGRRSGDTQRRAGEDLAASRLAELAERRRRAAESYRRSIGPMLGVLQELAGPVPIDPRRPARRAASEPQAGADELRARLLASIAEAERDKPAMTAELGRLRDLIAVEQSPGVLRLIEAVVDESRRFGAQLDLAGSACREALGLSAAEYRFVREMQPATAAEAPREILAQLRSSSSKLAQDVALHERKTRQALVATREPFLEQFRDEHRYQSLIENMLREFEDLLPAAVAFEAMRRLGGLIQDIKQRLGKLGPEIMAAGGGHVELARERIQEIVRLEQAGPLAWGRLAETIEALSGQLDALERGDPAGRDATAGDNGAGASGSTAAVAQRSA